MLNGLKQWWHSRNHKQDYEKKWPELPIQHLVYYRDSPDCGAVIVFVDWSGDLDWLRDDKAEEAARKNPDPQLPEVNSEVAILESRVVHWPSDLKISVKRLLGEALALALCGNSDAGLNSLTKTRNFIRDKGKEVSRYWTLQACAAAASVAVISGLVAIACDDQLIRVIGHTPYVMLLAAACGGIGSFLSVFLRLGNLNADARAEQLLHYTEAVARVFAGSIFGILAGALVRLGVLFPVFGQAGFEVTAICAAAIIAGASERLVPSIIARAEVENSREKG